MRHALAASCAAAAAALLLAAPAPAHAWGWGSGTSGSGKKVTQAREVGDFKAVRLKGSLDVRVTVGPARLVAVTIDENLQPLVTTTVSGDTLVIDTGNVSYHGEGRVQLSVPSLRAFAIEGSGDVVIDGGQGDLDLSVAGSGDLRWRGQAGKLAVSIAGSGDVTLAGKADALEASVAGSGDVRAAGLTARSGTVSVAGSGDVELTLDGGTLQASVAGSGDVVWHGTATVDRASAFGSGSIVHR